MLTNEILYMIAVAAIGFAITFFFRAIPFILFAGENREIPVWVVRFAFLSPVIIACLIVYAYSGLQWKTCFPYLAGVLTIALQAWKKNPLASICAGTALYMTLLATSGCASATASELRFDSAKPCVAITTEGIKFGEKFVLPQEVPELLKAHNVPTDATIHILLDDNYTDRRAPWVFQHNILGRAGYRRSILVSKRRAEAHTVEPQQNSKDSKKKFRYKKGNE